MEGKELVAPVTQAVTQEQIELIKRTVAIGATDTELKLFLYQAKKRGLDPLTRQIHFIKRKRYNSETEKYEEVGTIQTGIDGFRVIADRTGKLAGISRGVLRDPGDSLIGAWAEVYRKDWTHPAREEVSLKEYCQKKKDGSPMGLWATMPETMIKKVAEAAALRMAFPEDLSGIYTHDEMHQADVVEVSEVKPEPKKVKGKPEPQPEPSPKRLQAIQKPVEEETNDIIPVEQEDITSVIWADVSGSLVELIDAHKVTIDNILGRLKVLGATKTDTLETAFESLTPEKKVEFKTLVETFYAKSGLKK